MQNFLNKKLMRNSMRRYIYAILLFLITILPTTAFAHFTASKDSVVIDSLVLKINLAAKSVSFSGVQERTMIHAGKRMQFRWRVHYWAPDQILIQFLAPDTLRQTAFYKDEKVLKIRGEFHAGKSLRRGGASRFLQEGQLLQEIELLRQNYDVHVKRGSPYLQRPIYHLSIEPKFANRPAFFAKVDAETGLLLETRRMPALAKSDTAAQVSRYIEIDYQTPDENLKNQEFTTIDSLRQRREAEKYNDLVSLMLAYKGTLLIPDKLPAGFTLRRIRAFQNDERAFVHLLYGDGLSIVSLFMRENGDSEWHEHRKRSPMRHHLAMAQGEKAGVHYHIVGEIALAELEEMAAGLVPIARKTPQQQNIYFFIAIAFVLVGGFFLVKRKMEKSNV
jgi:negative regulator of sigma E activity